MNIGLLSYITASDTMALHNVILLHFQRLLNNALGSSADE
jgi:hypothetical protein